MYAPTAHIPTHLPAASRSFFLGGLSRVVAAGCGDGSVKVFDLKQPMGPILSLDQHRAEVRIREQRSSEFDVKRFF